MLIQSRTDTVTFFLELEATGVNPLKSLNLIPTFQLNMCLLSAEPQLDSWKGFIFDDVTLVFTVLSLTAKVQETSIVQRTYIVCCVQMGSCEHQEIN